LPLVFNQLECVTNCISKSTYFPGNYSLKTKKHTSSHTFFLIPTGFIAVTASFEGRRHPQNSRTKQTIGKD